MDWLWTLDSQLLTLLDSAPVAKNWGLARGLVKVAGTLRVPLQKRIQGHILRTDLNSRKVAACGACLLRCGALSRSSDSTRGMPKNIQLVLTLRQIALS